MCLPLFDSTFTTDDPQLSHLLARSDSAEVRAFLEELWQKYCPRINAKEEVGFRKDLKAQPHGRIWEMYLALALLNCGLDLADKLSNGPDVQLRTPTIWVEAVASTDGNDEKKSTLPLAGVPEVMLPECSGGPPEDQMIERWLTGIDEKLKKLNGRWDKETWKPGYIDDIVSKTDPYVVALNTHQTSFSLFDHLHTPGRPPMIAFVFGYGGAVWRSPLSLNGLPPPPSIPSGIAYPYRSQIKKKSGIEVPSDIFLQEKYSNISALIFSKEGFWSWQNRIPSSLSEDFALVHNPFATNQLPNGWLKSGHEIWIEQGQLHKRFWRDREVHSCEPFPLPDGLPVETMTKFNRLNLK